MQQPPFYSQPTGQQPPMYPPLQKPPKKRRRLWIILAIIGGVLVLSCGICGVVGAFAPPTKQAAQPTAVAVATATDTPTQVPTATSSPSPTPSPTATPTPKPTPKPTVLAVKPTPKPTQKPLPTPTPKPHCVAVNNNPWCYNFSPGGYIYSPPSAFCSYFGCIGNFWNGHGFVNECNDGMYSKSGGVRGDCSYHGGEMRPLYSH
jgi:hypothetical protein